MLLDGDHDRRSDRLLAVGISKELSANIALPVGFCAGFLAVGIHLLDRSQLMGVLVRREVDPVILNRLVILAVNRHTSPDANLVGLIGFQTADDHAGAVILRRSDLDQLVGVEVIAIDLIGLSTGKGSPAHSRPVFAAAAHLDIGDLVGDEIIVDAKRAVVIAAAIYQDRGGADAVIVLPGDVAVAAERAVPDVQRVVAVLDSRRGTHSLALGLDHVVRTADRSFKCGDVDALLAADGADVVLVPLVAGSKGFAALVGFAAGLADGLNVAILCAGTGVARLGLVKDVIITRVKHLFIIGDPTLLEHACDHVDLIVLGVLHFGKAGVLGLVHTCQALLALKVALLRTIDPAVLAVGARLIFGEMDLFSDQALFQIVCIHISIVVCGRNGQIDCFESHRLSLASDFFKVEIRVVHSGIGFLADRACDVIDGAVVQLNRLVILQRAGPCESMIMSGEDEVDIRFIDRGRQDLVDDALAAFGVGVVRGLVQDKDFPRCVAGGGILLQPCGSIFQALAVKRKVDRRNINISVSDGIMLCARVDSVHGFGSGSRRITILLMVADYVQNICVNQGTVRLIHKIQEILPGIIVQNFLNGVAQLDAQRIVPAVVCDHAIELHSGVGAVFLGLRIAEDKDVGCLVRVLDCSAEGTVIRPVFSVTHAVLIFRVRLQSGDDAVIDQNGCVHKALERRFAIYAFLCSFEILICRSVFDHSLLRCL